MGYPKPLHWWTENVLPLVYDESLSYYEVMSKIVTYINGITQDTIQTQELVEEIKELVENAGYNTIPEILARLDELDSTIASLNADNVQNKSDIATLKTDNTQNKADIANLKTDSTQNKADIADLKTDNTQNKTDIANLKTDNTQNKADIVDIKTDVANLKTDNTQNKADIANLKTDNTQNKADIANLKTDNTQNKADIADLKIDNTQNKADIADLKIDNTQNKEDIAELKNDIDYSKAPIIIDTEYGAIVSFDYGADNMPIKQLTTNVNLAQAGSGEPSPTNIRPISGWTGANVTRAGKNLYIGSPSFDGYTNVNNWTLEAEKYNGNEVRSRTAAYGGLYKEIYLKEGTYTFSVYAKASSETTSTWIYLKVNNVSTAELSVSQSSAVRLTTSWSRFTLAFNVITAGTIHPRIETGTSDITWYVSEYQLELGSTASAYESYQGNTYSMSWQSEAGTIYGGTLDVTSGILTVVKGMADLGALDWKYSTANARFETLTALNNVLAPDAYDSDVNAVSSIYKVVPYDQIASINYSLTIIFKTSAAAGNVWIKNSDYTDATVFKTAMSGAQLVYELATPIEITLTPTEVTTLLGLNNVWVDCGPSTVEYPCDTKLYIQNINAPTNDDMIADAQIASGKYFIIDNTLYLSTTIIPAGDTIIPGTNCVVTNLAEALNALNA